MNSPVFIPARNDTASWKLLLNKCPKWMICMQFTKLVSHATPEEASHLFSHPACMEACKKVAALPTPTPKQIKVQKTATTE